MSEKIERKARRKAICAIHQPVYDMKKLEQHGQKQDGIQGNNDHKTRLTCPKGLLISTEAPKSGEVYRHRSNTDVVITDKTRIATFHDSDLEKNKIEILIELEQSEKDRKKLLKENERLQEELDNRNKVIDHLIDYMKSLIPTEENEIEGN